MPRLTDLANEVLLQIASYLEPDAERHVGPFHTWGQLLEIQAKRARRQLQTVNALALSCKRLHGLVTPVLYSYIALTDTNRYAQPQLPLLLHTLENNESLKNYVRRAAVGGLDASQFQALFWLPRIHSLSIRDFADLEAWEWEGEEHVGTSPVRTLRLANCGAHEPTLTDILSWPSALEELWYEADQVEWDGHYEGEEAPGYSVAAVERCLKRQAGSLRKLVFSRPVQCHEGLGYSGVVDLSGFTKLESLSINHVFLVSWDQDSNVCERLPKSLVELDVFYDDHDYVTFMMGDAQRPGWLFDLLEKKRQCCPALERVRILSFEWDSAMEEQEEEGEEGEEGEEREQDQQGDWVPGRELVQAFARAEVSFSLYLHEDRRFKYVANGKGWEDEWEAKVKDHMEALENV